LLQGSIDRLSDESEFYKSAGEDLTVRIFEKHDAISLAARAKSSYGMRFDIARNDRASWRDLPAAIVYGRRSDEGERKNVSRVLPLKTV
jgi:hypothetical protein